MMEGLAQFVEASGLLEDVKVVQQGLPVTHDPEDPAANTADTGRTGAEIELRKVKNYRVLAARVDRNRIRKMAKPLAREEIRIGRILKWMRLSSQRSVCSCWEKIGGATNPLGHSHQPK